MKKEEVKAAMDAQIDALKAQYKAANAAARAVRSVVGEVAMDSAEEIYGFALDQMGIKHEGIEGVPALSALFNLAHSRPVESVPVAMDGANSLAKIPGLNRIRSL